jgi:hypothetical protein
MTPGPQDGSVASAQTAGLRYTKSAAAAIRQAGAADRRLDAGFIDASVRRIVAAWARAVQGDETALAAFARPEAVQALLHPVRAGQRTRLTARDLRVTDITVDRSQPDAWPPVLVIRCDCRGVRLVEDLGTGSVLSGDRDAEAAFLQILEISPDGPEPWPWRVTAGDTRTFSPVLDYMFSSGRETPAEYRERTGAAATPPQAARSVRAFQIRADFTEHDERRTGSATVVVERDTAPTRDEAAALASPAIWQATVRLLGEGDWRPSLSRLEVRELLG